MSTETTEPQLVELGGIEYQRETCRPCKGTGRKYDPTMADNVHGDGSGMVRCPRCADSHEPGFTYTITRRGLRQETERREARA